MAVDIFQAFSELPEPKQAKIEAECQEIESMAHQGGVTALTDEATDFHKNADFPEAIYQLNSFHGKVMWAFLEYPNYWAGSTSNLYTKNTPDASWKKRTAGSPKECTGTPSSGRLRSMIPLCRFHLPGLRLGSTCWVSRWMIGYRSRNVDMI